MEAILAFADSVGRQLTVHHGVSTVAANSACCRTWSGRELIIVHRTGLDGAAKSDICLERQRESWALTSKDFQKKPTCAVRKICADEIARQALLYGATEPIGLNVERPACCAEAVGMLRDHVAWRGAVA